MKTFSKILLALAFAVIVAAFVQPARADEGNWATQVTIDQPIQIGGMILAPGSYIFRLADIWAPDVVMIYSVNTQRWDGMIMGTPAFRAQASEKPTFVFEKVTRKSPEVLEYWYYPDSTHGIAFPVHRMKGVAAASAAHIKG